MKIKNILYAALAILVLSMPACVKSTGMTPTSQSPSIYTPVKQPGELEITSKNVFVDPNGNYYVVGLVMNNSSEVVNSIQLSVEIKDESSNSLLKDENGNLVPNIIIYPMLYTIAPGETSPFVFIYVSSTGTPASYNITISGQQTGIANRVNLQWEKVQIVDDGFGWSYLSGYLVNTSSQWAHINNLAGGVLDDSNNIISANWTSSYSTELAPSGDALGRDRTPFEVKFPNPGELTNWKLYWDADKTDSVTDYPMEVKVSNLYFDQYGVAHLIGWLTNQSSQPLDSLVIAGLYSADGTVLDSNYAYVPIPMNPGEPTPFSVSSFESVNSNPNLASLVSTASIQVDPWFTSPPTSEFVDLTASYEIVKKNGATWIFEGDVINSSGKDLSGATVVVMVMDSQNKLVAMEYTSISPKGDSIAAGETNTYSVSVSLDLATGTTGFTTTTMVVGDVK
jgi:hypothetical protein